MFAIGFLSRAASGMRRRRRLPRFPSARDRAQMREVPAGSAADGAIRTLSLKFCPRCSNPGLIRIEGCDTCLQLRPFPMRIGMADGAA
jgi:hypothetical protein